MSFPHFGHPYGSASQVRGASARDGGDSPWVEGMPSAPGRPPLTRVSGEAKGSRGRGDAQYSLAPSVPT